MSAAGVHMAVQGAERTTVERTTVERTTVMTRRPRRAGDAPTLAIETHGCKLNQADSSALALEFARAGYRIVPDDGAADVYVLNTCTVTHVADRKARHALRAARRRNPNATIVATGCYPQRDPAPLSGMDEVDLVTGNSDKASLVRIVAEWRGDAPVPCAVGDDMPLQTPRIARTRAMVKIQEGCDQVCAYCIVPKVRGRERSIPPEAILDQVKDRVERGYKEVVLTGTQLGTYGFDIEGLDLRLLLGRVLLETAVPRLRVSSLQPQEITAELLDLWADPRLCPHFHMPLQSGSDEVLVKMRRRYTAGRYAETVAAIRRAVPQASVTADVIVGFPGETDADFSATYDLCEAIGFAATHVFPYSPRPGTSAAHLADQVAPESKAERASLLRSLSERKSVEFRERLLGSVRPVLWEARSSESPQRWSGLTDNYVKVVCDSPRDLTNTITDARLLQRRNGNVVAEPCGGRDM